MLKESVSVDWRSVIPRGDERVVYEVLRAANDMNADDFDRTLLLGFLKIESGAKAIHTFYNPSLERYRGVLKRPHKVRGIRPIGPFQILQAYQDSYRKYGYDPGQFGDPYHQAKVVLRFIKDRRRSVGDDPARIYLSWNQGVGGANKIYQALRNAPNVEIGALGRRLARNMRGNFSAGALKRYGLSSKDQLTPLIFVDRYNRLLGFSGGDYALPQKNVVYLLGDSNTVAHLRYWKAFAAKNFGSNTHLINYSQNGNSLSDIASKLNKIKGAAGIIIGSGGGNDVAALGKIKNPEQILRKISPGSAFYNRSVLPVMEKLRQFKEDGTRVVFYGLPFGRGAGTKCGNNTPIARQAMDEALKVAAFKYQIRYFSVFQSTKTIKGANCGVHYGKSQQEYRDALRSANPNESPAAIDELRYAKSISGGRRIKLGFNQYLSPYRHIKAAGLTFGQFYKKLEQAFGANWEMITMPILGADRVFGPEHFAALIKLAEKTQDPELLALVNQKMAKGEEPAIAKAEKSAKKKIDKKTKTEPATAKDEKAFLKKIDKKAAEAEAAGDKGPVIDDPKKAVDDIVSAEDDKGFLSKILGSFKESTNKRQKRKIRIILKS